MFKKIKLKSILSGVLALTMVLSLNVGSAFATELTPEMLADVDKLNTVAGTYDGTAYNVYEGQTEEGKASTAIKVNIAPTILNAKVPIALHVTRTVTGEMLFPDSMDSTFKGLAGITMKSPLGQLRVINAQMFGANLWELEEFNAEFKEMKVNTKKYGFKINGIEVQKNGNVLLNNLVEDTIKSTFDINLNTAGVEEFEDYSFTRTGSSPFPVITNGSTLPITYEAKLPAMTNTVDNVIVGGVVFTLGFN